MVHDSYIRACASCHVVDNDHVRAALSNHMTHAIYQEFEFVSKLKSQLITITVCLLKASELSRGRTDKSFTRRKHNKKNNSCPDKGLFLVALNGISTGESRMIIFNKLNSLTKALRGEPIYG